VLARIESMSGCAFPGLESTGTIMSIMVGISCWRHL
jgi:hypothetical protein